MLNLFERKEVDFVRIETLRKYIIESSKIRLKEIGFEIEERTHFFGSKSIVVFRYYITKPGEKIYKLSIAAEYQKPYCITLLNYMRTFYAVEREINKFIFIVKYKLKGL